MTKTDSAVIETHFSIVVDDVKVVELLHEASALSRQQIKQAMQKGAVWVTRGKKTQRLRRATRRLRCADEIHLYYNRNVLAEEPSAPTLIVDKGAYSVWDKPYGLRSQGSKWGDHCTVVRWSEQHLKPERSALTVHRLDRAANGLILIAHSKSMAATLSALFQERRIEKRYRAVVEGDFSANVNPLRIDDAIAGKTAVSEVSFMRFADDSLCSIVDVKIETGRKHQIRRHLASIGYPVVGDRLYGDGKDGSVDLQLTACALAFHCPVDDVAVEYQIATQ